MKKLHLIFWLLIFSVLQLAGCSDSASDDQQLIGIFPAENLEQARSYAVTESGNSALLIWQDGELILEEYNSMDGQTFHPIFSGTKSLAGLMAALAIRDGHLTFNTPLSDLIEGWKPDTERGKITVAQLLNLTSGLETAPAGSYLNQSPDIWLNAQMAFERGTTFVYGPTPFYLLAHVFMETLNINPVQYLNQELFEPLGLRHPKWQLYLPGQIPNLSFGAEYTPIDWLQLGLFLLNEGNLNGNPLIPQEIFSRLLEPTESAPNFGITFWLNKTVSGKEKITSRHPEFFDSTSGNQQISDTLPEDAYMKSGLFGQRLYVIPSLNLVIVRLGPPNQTYNDHQFFSRLMQGVAVPTI